jgi:Zn-dependent peptidase ImmA (M78 family)
MSHGSIDWFNLKECSPESILIKSGLYEPPIDLDKLFLNINIIFKEEDLEENIGGFCYYNGKETAIIVNKNLDNIRKRVEATHQLCRILYMTKSLNTFCFDLSRINNSIIDERTGKLIADFLVPLSLLKDEIKNIGRDYRKLSSVFMVNKNVMLLRLKHLDDISDL